MKSLKVLIVTSFILVGTLPAFAQEEQTAKWQIKWEGNALTRYFVRAKEKKHNNKIGVVEASASLNAQVNPDDPVTLLFGYNFKHVLIDSNSSNIDLPATLVGREMPMGLKFPMPFVDDSNYRLGAVIIPAYYTDSWEDSFNNFEHSAFRWLSEYWAEYNGTDNLTWKIGVRVRPGYDLKVLPVVGLNYRFNDRYAFRLSSDDLGLVYTVNEKTKLFTEHLYALDEYEISQNGRNGRVLQHQQNTTGIGAQYEFIKGWTAKASTGMAYNRSFKFVDEPGTKTSLKETMYYSVEIKGVF
jgi:hypothetical protein